MQIGAEDLRRRPDTQRLGRPVSLTATPAAAPAPEIQTERSDPARELLRAVRRRLVNAGDSAGSAQTEASGRAQADAVRRLLEEEYHDRFRHLELTTAQRHQLATRVEHDLFGLGILEPLLADPHVKEIMVNGPTRVFVERDGVPQVALDSAGSPLRFDSESDLYHLIERMVGRVNRRVDESTPVVDARLPDGARVSVVIPPVSLLGPTVTIRKFPSCPFTLPDLVRRGTLSPEAASFLQRLVGARCNVIVSGGTSSGKTTLLNALLGCIPHHERLITIEDAAELQVSGILNLIRMEARPANVEGRGAITIRDLVRASLRMRPDRIIVGECRGGEALDMLQAMNTGHDGSLTTVHANSAGDALGRVETMALMAGPNIPPTAVRRQIGAAVQFVIHLTRQSDGRRRVRQIAEVRLVSDDLICRDLFRLNREGTQLRPTGLCVEGREPFLLAGLPLPPGL